MAIRSLLFGTLDSPDGSGSAAEPEHFADLHLDQVVRAVVRGDAGAAAPFHRPLRDPALVEFRQRVFRDLEDPVVREVVERFAAGMDATRRRREALGRVKHAPQAHWWFLEIVLDHAATVRGLAEGLEAAEVGSPGLRALRDDVAEHVRGASFAGVRERARRLRDRLGEIRYDLLLRDDKIAIAEHDADGRLDYAERVLATFERFRQGRAPERRPEPPPETGLDHVEADVLDLVVKLFPEVFRELATFCAAHRDFVADEIVRVDRELRFYLGYLAYLEPLRAAGLPVCHPLVSATDKGLLARDVYDLALAAKLVEDGGPVVVNDMHLDGDERILVVSGPNQGGKTTLSRTFGQLHHLAALGLPVPGREVRIFLPDRIFTHYERAETLDNLASKLEDDLLRLRAILDRATPDSVIILNEIFTSTTSDDARTLSRAVLDEIERLDVPCLWVSFIDELSRMSPRAVSMVGTVTDDGRSTRTYKVVRGPADGRAYAVAIAEKHGLTYTRLTERVGR